MTDITYNGWSNYETWSWKLWLDNDQGTYEYWQERIRELIDQTEPEFDWQTKADAVRYALAGELENDCDNMQEAAGIEISEPFADILSAGLSRIDWHEIAENMLYDFDIPEDDEDAA